MLLKSEEFVDFLKMGAFCQGFVYSNMYLFICLFITLFVYLSVYNFGYLFLTFVNYLKAGVLRQESWESGRYALKGAV